MKVDVIDCNFPSLEEAISGIEIPSDIRESLVLIDLRYHSFDEKTHQGQMVLHQELAKDVSEIFDVLLEAKFPVERVVPVVMYGWDDEVSMRANNTSAFNYRPVLVPAMPSQHALGRALDLNPLLNPWISESGLIQPATGVYDTSVPGTITPESLPVSLFKERGWAWGGEWQEPVDYQHFQKKEA